MVEQSARLQSAFTAVARIPKPVVAAITGYAWAAGASSRCVRTSGGGRGRHGGPARDHARIIPGAGGTQRLSRLVGPSRAKDIIFTGRFVPAREALSIGMVDRLTPSADVYATAMAWAGQFAEGPAYALRAAKEAIDTGLEVDLSSGLEMERTKFAALFATEDRASGMASFVDNGPGKATFRGR
jgi:enoyl-CoA hydratase/carnithine racemase